ncbi:hypothetical protein NIES3974_38850 [Calothrix sp. NIES-3974]|nr:hypothetical protein NIES3974_38850 [Calothrix sp. NIES-3974]
MELAVRFIFGIHEGLLRLFTADAKLVPTPEETAIQEGQPKLEKLAAKLGELGIEPDSEVE